jgi:hypothetical protein
MQPSVTCAGFNSNWNSLKGFSVLAVVLRPQDILLTPAVGKMSSFMIEDGLLIEWNISVYWLLYSC